VGPLSGAKRSKIGASKGPFWEGYKKQNYASSVNDLIRSKCLNYTRNYSLLTWSLALLPKMRQATSLVIEHNSPELLDDQSFTIHCHYQIHLHSSTSVVTVNQSHHACCSFQLMPMTPRAPAGRAMST